MQVIVLQLVVNAAGDFQKSRESPAFISALGLVSFTIFCAKMPCAWLQFVLFVAVFSLVANGKLHSIQRFKRQTQLFGAHKPLVANDMPEPIGFGDLSRVLMVGCESNVLRHYYSRNKTNHF